MRRALGEADLLEQGERAIAQLVGGDADRRQLRLDVLERRQRRDQVELLEDEAERLQAQVGELAVAEHPEVASLEEDAPGARPVERAEQLQQGRLAGSARAFERDELARSDLEVDAAHGLDDRRAPLEEALRALDVVQHVSHHSTWRRASAGRRREARKAPAAPAMQAAEDGEDEADQRGCRRRWAPTARPGR